MLCRRQMCVHQFSHRHVWMEINRDETDSKNNKIKIKCKSNTINRKKKQQSEGRRKLNRLRKSPKQSLNIWLWYDCIYIILQV